jgi:predicted nucleic acid-binding protein
MSRVYWDTMLFIYWLEDAPGYADKVDRIHRRMTERGDTLCSSTFALGEILTAPYKKKDDQAAATIKEYMLSREVELLPFDKDAADLYARIRATQKVSRPDAIHLASAAAHGIDLYLTNDTAVRNAIVPGIQFIDGLDTGVL